MAPALTNRIWIKKVDSSPEGDWTSFSLVNEKTGHPTWEKKFFPNRFHFTHYPKEGLSDQIIVGADFLDSKPRKTEIPEKNPKPVIRTRIFYGQPGFYHEGDFIENEEYPGKPYVEFIRFSSKTGRSYKNDQRRNECHFNPDGSLDSFLWELTPPLLGDRMEYQTVTVKGIGEWEPMTFKDHSLCHDPVETELMRQWFAENARFPVPSAFDFSYVGYDDFKPIDGKKDCFTLELK